MGSVFKARDARLHREVAIKVLPLDSMKDDRLVKRFQLEARSAAPSGEFAQSDPHDLTRTGFVVGTLGYMSPEQAGGDDVGPASDLFVLGILLYELATGIAPFARPNLEEAFEAILKARAPEVL